MLKMLSFSFNQNFFFKLDYCSLMWGGMFRNWLIISAFVSGIVFFLLGIYYYKSDPNSWVRSSSTGIEFPEWFTHIFTGAFFVIMAGIIFFFLP